MNITRKIIILTVLIIALVWPTPGLAKELHDDEVVFGGTFTLASGDRLDGNLVVLGGAAILEQDSVVNGDVALIGGSLAVDGVVNGNLFGMGGALRLNSHARINGDLTTVGATLRREEGSQVSGQVNTGVDVPLQFTLPDGMDVPGIRVPEVSFTFNPILEVFWFFFRLFMWAALAVLIVLFFSEHADRVAQAALSQPVITGGVGLLTAILAPVALIVVTITIILIPVSFVAIILLIIGWLFGWISLGLEVGRRIAKALHQEWAPAVSAGVGTFVLLFVMSGFAEVITCIGWPVKTLVGLWGLGSVIMTIFGTQAYPTTSAVLPQSAQTEDGPQDPESPDAVTTEGESLSGGGNSPEEG
jgi:hypothetical protein